jgi:PAS domain S-box-containing protein
MFKSHMQTMTHPFGWLLRFAKQGWLVALIISMTAAVVLFLTLQVASRMTVIRSAPQDNVQWSLAQLDVELLALDIAAKQATSGNASELAQFRQRFNVFYSRIKTTATMPIFRENRDTEASDQIIELIQSKLDQLIPVVDSADEELKQRIGELITTFEELRPLARQVTLNGVKLYAARSDVNRADFATLLWKTAIFNALLVLALGTTMLFLLRQINISKRRADALQVSSDRNVSTLVTSLDAIIIVNMEGRVVEFNEAATQIFGFSRNAAIGEKLEELIIPERYRERHKKVLAQFRATGQSKVIGSGRMELASLKSDGTEFPIEFSLGVTNSSEGQLVICFLRDISKRIEQEAELRKARDEALEASQTKSQFLAIMSHEMRTPLNGVMAVLDLLSASRLNIKQKRLVSTATTSSEILKQHVDDVLDLTRIHAGKLELFPRVFDIVELFEEIQSISVAMAAKRGNRLILEIDFPNPYFIADRKRIHQVLTNLVGNAIKFTESGRIVISAKPSSVSNDFVTIEFKVRDTGIGIAKHQQSRIFEDFVTLDSSYQRNAGGTGLGLPICRSIVEAMGGTIGVESEVGSGSTFWFQLPLKAGFEKNKPNSLLTSLKTKSRKHKMLKVLVVEDNETNRFVAGEMLDAQGCDVVMAKDGAEGTEIAELQRFDLILMDLSMPKMNGWDAARRIRATVASKSRHSLIYALTAHALPEEQETVLKAGMQGCLLKPLRAKELDDLLRTVSGNLMEIIGDNTQKKKLPKNREMIVDFYTSNELHEMLGENLFKEKLGAFYKELEAGLDNIRRQLGLENFANVGNTAHKLAGSAAVFGAVQLQYCLVAIERAANGDSTKDVYQLVKKAELAAKRLEADPSLKLVDY